VKRFAEEVGAVIERLQEKRGRRDAETAGREMEIETDLSPEELDLILARVSAD
jgi:hypothetical protein